MDLPRDVQISSHVRHSVVMAVKEGIHNVIKHANATEVTVRVEFKNSVLTISIRDNGRGFQTSDLGNGLPNMRRRLVDIGGVCLVESSATDGTTVQMRLSIPTLGPASRKTLFYRARKPGPFPTN
jgi:signal transduction histidine kinase